MLIDYLPGVVSQIKEIQEICKAEQPEFDKAREMADRALLNIFAISADETGIERIEKELGIVPGPDATLEDRRTAIIIKNTKSKLDINMIKSLVATIAEELTITPEYEAGKIAVNISETITNVKEIYKTLDEVIDLGISIYFTLNMNVKSSIVNIAAIEQYDWWYLDGSLKLDGSRYLGPETITEVL